MRVTDTGVGIVLGIVLVGATAGGLWAGGAGGDTATSFVIEWTTVDETTVLPPRDHDGAGTEEIEFAVNATPRIASVRVDATVSGGGPRIGDRGVSVEVVPPGGLDGGTDSGSLAQGAMQSTISLTVDVPVTNVPESASVAAPNQDAAARQAEAGAANTTGTGTWILRVTFDANPADNFGGGEGHRIAVTVHAFTFHATAAPASGVGGGT